MLADIFAAIIEFFANAPVPNILIIFGIFFILLANIQSQHIAIKRKKFNFIFGILLLAGGLGIYAFPLLPPGFIPQKIMNIFFGPATEKIIISQHETKKVFDGHLVLTPLRIAGTNARFKVSDCSNQNGLLYCVEKKFLLKKDQTVYRGQDYDFFFEVLPQDSSSGSLALQITQREKQEEVGQ